MITREELEKLKLLVGKATPGPWEPERYDADNGYIHYSVNDSEMRQVAFCHEDMHPKTYKFDASFIAASNPEFVTRLIEALELATEYLEKYEQDDLYSNTEYAREALEKIYGEKK